VHEMTQPVALERPAAEGKSAFEEVQGILNVGPDAGLVILKKVLRVSIERGTIGRAVTIRLAVPDCRRRRRIAGRIVIQKRALVGPSRKLGSQGVVMLMPAPS
jgi:hypothetical protein